MESYFFSMNIFSNRVTTWQACSAFDLLLICISSRVWSILMMASSQCNQNRSQNGECLCYTALSLLPLGSGSTFAMPTNSLIIYLESSSSTCDARDLSSPCRSVRPSEARLRILFSNANHHFTMLSKPLTRRRPLRKYPD